MARTVTLPNLIQLRLSDDMARQIDDWRRGQTDIPTRSEAIRRLVALGLQTGAEATSAPTVWEMLAEVLRSTPDWQEIYGFGGADIAISDAIEGFRKEAQKRGLRAALSYFFESEEGLDADAPPTAEERKLRALLARVDPFD